MDGIIFRILDIEEKARSIAHDAKELEKNIELEVAAEIEKIREDIQTKTQAKIKQIREKELMSMKENLDTAESDAREKMQRLSHVAKEKREKWVDAIVAQLTAS